MERSGRCQFAQFGLEGSDPAVDASTVDLDLGLAAAEAGPDPTALLGEFRRAASAEPRKPVAQEGELDLGATLEGVGVLGEDVEDHRGAIDRRAPEQLLELELLGRVQLVVEDHGVGVDRQTERPELLGLPLADEEGVIGGIATLDEPSHHIGPGGVDQQFEFVETRIGVVLGGSRQRHPDEHDPLADRPVDERGAERL